MSRAPKGPIADEQLTIVPAREASRDDVAAVVGTALGAVGTRTGTTTASGP